MSPGEAAEAALVSLLEKLNAAASKSAPISIVEWHGPPDLAQYSDTVRTGHEIIRAVQQATGVAHLDFVSHRRCKSFCEARQIAYWFMRHYTALSYPQIGSLTGGRDHSTVMHGVKQVNNRPEFFGPRVQTIAKLLQVKLPEGAPFH